MAPVPSRCAMASCPSPDATRPTWTTACGLCCSRQPRSASPPLQPHPSHGNPSPICGHISPETARHVRGPCTRLPALARLGARPRSRPTYLADDLQPPRPFNLAGSVRISASGLPSECRSVFFCPRSGRAATLSSSYGTTTCLMTASLDMVSFKGNSAADVYTRASYTFEKLVWQCARDCRSASLPHAQSVGRHGVMAANNPGGVRVRVARGVIARRAVVVPVVGEESVGRRRPQGWWRG